jgi:hypothetical protein
MAPDEGATYLRIKPSDYPISTMKFQFSDRFRDL